MTEARSTTRHHGLLLVAPALLAGIWLLLALTHLDFFAYEDDEGTFLLTAQALARGHALYREVWFNYFSGLMELLQAVRHLTGLSLLSARGTMALLTALTALCSAEIARRVAGPLASLLTVVLLLLMPEFSLMGRSVMAEVPAAVCGALAMIAMLNHLCSHRPAGVALAGMLAGLGIWFKYPTAVLLAPLVVALWVDSRQRGLAARQLAALMALLLTMAAAPLVLAILRYDLAAQWHQIAGTLVRSWDYYTLRPLDNVVKLLDYIEDNNGAMLPLSLLGLVWLARRDRARAWLLGGWLWFYLTSMLVSTPLAPHHMHLFLAPLAILAALALTRLPALLRALRHGTQVRDGAIELTLVVLSLLLLLALGPEVIESTVEAYTSDVKRNESLYEAAALVAAHTQPGDYCLSDHAMVLYRAGCPAPPWLTNLSGMRFRTQGVTVDVLRAATATYQPVIIVFWEDKFTNSAPGYVSQVQASYAQLHRDDERQDDGELRLRAIYLRSDRAP